MKFEVFFGKIKKIGMRVNGKLYGTYARPNSAIIRIYNNNITWKYTWCNVDEEYIVTGVNVANGVISLNLSLYLDGSLERLYHTSNHQLNGLMVETDEDPFFATLSIGLCNYTDGQKHGVYKTTFARNKKSMRFNDTADRYYCKGEFVSREVRKLIPDINNITAEDKLEVALVFGIQI